jgi:hypothetical protein
MPPITCGKVGSSIVEAQLAKESLMSWQAKVIAGLVLVLALVGAIVYFVLPERFLTRVDKSMLQFFGGDCVVEVYSAGQKLREYQVNGYVLFERPDGSATGATGGHDGVVTFKDRQGRTVRVGAWGGTVLVECK